MEVSNSEKVLFVIFAGFIGLFAIIFANIYEPLLSIVMLYVFAISFGVYFYAKERK
ncbi:MAG: hypothetical protein AB1779_09525 [Candidatus Thermoplasmatota archaeon]